MATTTDGDDPLATKLMTGIMCDQMRVWNHVPGSHTVSTTIRPAPGKIFVVKVIEVVEHPRPSRRKIRGVTK
jgi:hypothetical protein